MSKKRKTTQRPGGYPYHNLGPLPERLTGAAPASDLGPAGGMYDSRIKRPLDALLECHDALLKDYGTSDRKSFRRHVVSLLENTFGLLAALYGYDPWKHYLTESSPDLNDSGLKKILQAINDLKEHQQEWETPVEKNDDGFRYGGGPRFSSRWRTSTRSNASLDSDARGPLGFH